MSVIGKINSIKVKEKLVLLIIPPTLMSIILVWFYVANNIEDRDKILAAEEFFVFSIDLRKVIVESQIERGLSLGFAESKGLQYSSVLPGQREKLNKMIKVAQERIKSFGGKNEYWGLNLHFKEIGVAFGGLQKARKKIDQFDTQTAYKYYTDLNSLLLNLIENYETLGGSLEIVKLTDNLALLLWAQEYAGRERGVVNGMLSSNELTISSLEFYLSAHLPQNELIRNYIKFSGGQQNNKLIGKLSDWSDKAKYNNILQSINQKIRKTDLLNNLQIIIGYGGFIHNFKNYILRKDDSYLKLIDENLRQVMSLIEKYRKVQNITKKESDFLTDIENVLSDYKGNLVFAHKMISEGFNSEAIDKFIVVDDLPAINAIRNLNSIDSDYTPNIWWEVSTARINMFIDEIRVIEKKIIFKQSEALVSANLSMAYCYAWSTLVVLIVGLLLRVFIKRLSSDVLDISSAIDNMQASGRFDEPLPSSGSDEIAVMTKAFNKLLLQRLAFEKNLQASSNLKDTILKSAAEGIYGLDVKGNTTFANPASIEMLGYSFKEMENQAQHSLIHHSKNDGSPFLKEECNIYKAIKDGVVHHVANEVFWRKDGSKFPVEYTSTPINQNGKIIGAVVTFRDITERKRVESELRLYHEQLEEIVESKTHELEISLQRSKSIFDMPFMGMSILSLNKGFLEVNDQMCSITGYSRNELMLMKWDDISISEDMSSEEKYFLEIISGVRDKFSIESKYLRKDGSILLVDIFTSCVRDIDGEVKYYVSIVQDISERKKIDAEKEKLSQMKGEFLSTAAHELRTPLTTIRGYSELMANKDDLSLDIYKRFSKSISVESEQLSNIIDDLLDISKIEAGKSFGLNLRLASLIDCANNEIELYSTQGTGHHFSIKTIGTAYEILIDPVRVSQIFRNLFSNSVKYSERESEIATQIEFSEDEVLISISDKGIGMTLEQVDHIFDKFYRTNVVQNIQGTGLGMSIVDHLVRSHGGVINVESEINKGTTVHFRLPRYSQFWRDEFCVGIPSIDDQHKELFKLVEKLSLAINSGEEKESINLILNELVRYAEFHFKYEEDLFVKYGYADSKGHMKVHRYFQERIEGFKFISKSKNHNLPNKVISFLYNWLTEHILKEDMAYSTFLVQKIEDDE
jgi:hemerythrin-like metal-binding protein/PAS domain S-box-containing protein